MSDQGIHRAARWKKRRNQFKVGARIDDQHVVEADGPGPMTAKRRRTKRALFHNQQGRCAYCGVIFASIHEATIDHLIPTSRGGTDAFRNLRLACQPCNAAKGNKLPDDPDWLPSEAQHAG
jgi:5-methylcytosine-specific restriction endonuclease McrA